MRHLLLALSLTLSLGSACTEQQAGSDLCAQAKEHLVNCSVKTNNFASTCDEPFAESLLSLSCSELERGPSGGDTEDGWLGWRGKGEGCTLDWECEGSNICRFSGIATDEICLPPGGHGALCDRTPDCDEFTGLECIPAVDSTSPGSCRQPLN